MTERILQHSIPADVHFSTLIEEVDGHRQDARVKAHKNVYRGTIQVKNDDQAGVCLLQLPDKIQFVIGSWYQFDHYWSTGINVKFCPVCGHLVAVRDVAELLSKTWENF